MWVPRQRRPSQNWLWGPKVLRGQYMGQFCSFFLKGIKSQLRET